MSSTSSPTLLCDVRSRRAEPAVALLALAAGALGPSLVTSLDTTTACAVSLISTSLILLGLWRARWVGARRIVAVAWLSDGRWLLTDSRGATIEAALLGDSRVGGHWAWLRWSSGNSIRCTSSLLLAAGDISSGDLRRLIVRLRIDGVGRNIHATQLSPT
jgi:hypothetical protein